MNKQDKINAFDPNGASLNSSLFGLPFTDEESEAWVLPVPWEVTVSYGEGAAKGPRAILEASKQVDLFDSILENAWHKGVYMLKEDPYTVDLNNSLKNKAKEYIEAGNQEADLVLNQINQDTRKMQELLEQRCHSALAKNKRLIILGGDHSVPLAYLRVLAKFHGSFGVLQIDAHADLRKAYEGFEFSHASIMHNALELNELTKLVQVGIRDYCEEENNRIQTSPNRISTFFDRTLKNEQYQGITWDEQCDNIVAELPQKVYISFDIDGLDPKLCPNTGTPVAGGFETEEVLYLLEKVARSGREIVGMDLCEVVPGDDDWDANVAARLIYRMANIWALNASLL